MPAPPAVKADASPPPSLRWTLRRFADLDAELLYDILRARQDVFVVEQECPYPDIDGRDAGAWHLCGHADPGRDAEGRLSLAAYARLFTPGVVYAEASIGRILTTAPYRGTGLGRVLVTEALARLREIVPDAAVRIGAQAHLQPFYRSLGFVTDSEPYDEDGILHVEMVRPGPPPTAAG
jgi:ElaA protein